ncbi:MAG: hypothetical protein AAF689_16500 [Pseudomonadota bacterium]
MRFAILTLCAAVVSAPAMANEFEPAMRDYLDTEIRSWMQSPVLIDAIREMNTARAGYSQDDIDNLDMAWRSEIGTASTPTISPVLENAAAEFLRNQVAASSGRITEVFVMGAHGLNVAASGTTSDMWQGDEAKFSETYGVGADAVHIGDIELDESTQRYQGQISVTINDPVSGLPIGAMTIGIDAESLL